MPESNVVRTIRRTLTNSKIVCKRFGTPNETSEFESNRFCATEAGRDGRALGQFDVCVRGNNVTH